MDFSRVLDAWLWSPAARSFAQNTKIVVFAATAIDRKRVFIGRVMAGLASGTSHGCFVAAFLGVAFIRVLRIGMRIRRRSVWSG